MKRLALLLIIASLSFGWEPIPVDGDVANHAFVGSAVTKILQANQVKDTFNPMLAIGVGKEIYDCLKPNATGFSINDLTYWMVGWWLVDGKLTLAEIKF
jgi:hypothetical protein